MIIKSPPTPKPSRRWLQFSLRAVGAGARRGVGLAGSRRPSGRRARVQRKTVEAIHAGRPQVAGREWLIRSDSNARLIGGHPVSLVA
jgi:hypothetical protein